MDSMAIGDESQDSSHGSRPSISGLAELVSQLHAENDKYRLKYKKLRTAIRNTVFENAALCDEVAQVQEKILRVKEERRFLLKKLFHLQAMSEVSNQMYTKSTTAEEAAAGVTTPINMGAMVLKPADNSENKSKRKANLSKKSKDVSGESGKSKAKRKKASTAAKRIVQQIPLDATGRPIFPIVLGRLTVHSLGEVVADRPGFHSEEFIFPVGFCSTRIYASMKNPKLKCLYTCKISDGGMGPKFEIAAEDESDQPLVGTSATECHSKLLKAVNLASGADVIETTGRGAEFFGFSHPTIQNLIQSCPGARKCTSYKWVKFEVCRVEQLSDTAYSTSDNHATIHFDALQRCMNYIHGEENTQNVTVPPKMNVNDTSTPTMQSPAFPSLDLSDPSSLSSLLNNCVPMSSLTRS